MAAKVEPQSETFGPPAHPGASTAMASWALSGRRRKDTRPELLLRSALHASGLRFRVAYPVPGLPRRSIDIAFTKARLAVFVDGCFWHGCLEHGSSPRSNADWWQSKIQANRDRDRHTTEHLTGIGWEVLRIWEHEDSRVAALRVRELLAIQGGQSSDRSALLTR